MKTFPYDIDTPILYVKKNRYKEIWLSYPCYHDNSLVALAIGEMVSNIGLLLYFFGNAIERSKSLLRCFIASRDYLTLFYDDLERTRIDGDETEITIHACKFLRNMFLQDEQAYQTVFEKGGTPKDKLEFMRIMKNILIEHIEELCAELTQKLEEDAKVAPNLSGFHA